MTSSPSAPPTERTASPGRSGRPLAFTLAAVGCLAVLVWAANRYLTLDAILVRYDALREAVESDRIPALALFMLAYAAGVAVSLPGASLFTLLGGLLFGWLVGGIAAVLAATAGAILLFLLARTALGTLLADRAGPGLQKILVTLRADVASYLLFLRFAPIFPFWMVNIAAALLPAPLRIFAVTTAVGIVPATFAMASAGSALAHVVEKRKLAYDACVAAARQGCSFEIGVRHVLTPGILLSLAALAVLALVPVILKRMGIMPQWRSEPPPGDAA